MKEAPKMQPFQLQQAPLRQNKPLKSTEAAIGCIGDQLLAEKVERQESEDYLIDKTRHLSAQDAPKAQKSCFNEGTPKIPHHCLKPSDAHTPEYDRFMIKTTEKDCSICCKQGLKGNKLFYVVALGSKGGTTLDWTGQTMCSQELQRRTTNPSILGPNHWATAKRTVMPQPKDIPKVMHQSE
eukprot:13652075-Ditylum_brightwellii.AAC.1